jgi:hypothetical protein
MLPVSKKMYQYLSLAIDLKSQVAFQNKVSEVVENTIHSSLMPYSLNKYASSVNQMER